MRFHAPITDMKFLLFDVLHADELQGMEKYRESTPDVLVAIMEAMGSFAADVLQPTNKVGDVQGCSFDAQTRAVSTPQGFREAYNLPRLAGPASMRRFALAGRACPMC